MEKQTHLVILTSTETLRLVQQKENIVYGFSKCISPHLLCHRPKQFLDTILRCDYLKTKKDNLKRDGQEREKHLTPHAAGILLQTKTFILKSLFFFFLIKRIEKLKRESRTSKGCFENPESQIWLDVCFFEGGLLVRMWADTTVLAAADVASVMWDDREMSVSDIHPITFNRCLRRASSDDGQTAEIKVSKLLAKDVSLRGRRNSAGPLGEHGASRHHQTLRIGICVRCPKR